MIGNFCDIIFEVSDKKLYTFNGFKLDASARYGAHEIIEKKPKTEFIAPNLKTISLTINLSGNYGVLPIEEMRRWISLVETGEADYLVIGSEIMGEDKWVVKSVSETWDTFLNKGELFSGKIDVTFEEYIS